MSSNLSLKGSSRKSLDPKGGPPGTGEKDDKPDRRDQWDAEGSKGKKKTGKFDRIGNIDREQDSSHGGSQDAMEHDELDIDQQGQMPIAAYHPNVGMMELTADANISKENMGMIELNAAANTNKENSKQIWDPTTVVLHQKAILEPQQSESSKDTIASQEQMES